MCQENLFLELWNAYFDLGSISDHVFPAAWQQFLTQRYLLPVLLPDSY